MLLGPCIAKDRARKAVQTVLLFLIWSSHPARVQRVPSSPPPVAKQDRTFLYFYACLSVSKLVWCFPESSEVSSLSSEVSYSRTSTRHPLVIKCVAFSSFESCLFLNEASCSKLVSFKNLTIHLPSIIGRLLRAARN